MVIDANKFHPKVFLQRFETDERERVYDQRRKHGRQHELVGVDRDRSDDVLQVSF